MNDDFLHQLRRPPPLGFAARLRIKLNLPAETNGAPKFRVVSTWVALALLGGAAFAAASPGVRAIVTHIWSALVAAKSDSVPIEQARSVATLRPASPTTDTPGLSQGSVNSDLPERSAGNATQAGTSQAQSDTALAGNLAVAIDWVSVPRGSFTMGATDEQKAEFYKFSGSQNPWVEMQRPLVDGSGPSHQVFLDSFYISRNEVTNQQYDQFVETTGRTHLDAGGRFQGANQPVVNVTWNDAQSFCAWVGARLPSEAEWEKAARGTQGFVYPWGNTWDPTKLQSMDGIAHRSFADFDDYETWRAQHSQNNQDAKTANVGSFPGGASPYGVLDMAGNAWEWVNDWFDPTYYASSPKANPKGPATGTSKVLRGGAWDTPRSVDVTWIRQIFMAPNQGRRVTSFRCAKDAQ
jgi:formylglycine-generating enzyme required for sulfatase activity